MWLRSFLFFTASADANDDVTDAAAAVAAANAAAVAAANAPAAAAAAVEAAATADAVALPRFEPETLRPQTGVLPWSYTLTHLFYFSKLNQALSA